MPLDGSFRICSAMLATGGGLLFTGKETGEFIALDIENGKQLWQFQTGSGINAQPITFTHNGRQYVTVQSGIGGLYWNVLRARAAQGQGAARRLGLDVRAAAGVNRIRRTFRHRMALSAPTLKEPAPRASRRMGAASCVETHRFAMLLSMRHEAA